MTAKKELTPEQAVLMDKLAEFLKNKPETANRFTEYMEELSSLETLTDDIDPKKLYKPSDVIKMLSISRQTLYNLVESKQLKALKVGTYQKFIGQDLINFLKKEYGV